MAVEQIEVLPQDRFNKELVKNAHPPDWVNPEPAKKYNLVVIGGGTAGLVAAAGASALGAEVALVERHLMGGDCLNVGCVPSKGLIRSARTVGELNRAESFGIRIPEGATVDFPAVMERMRRIRAKISPNDSVARFADMGIDVFLGEGTFTGKRTAEVDGKSLEFSKAIIATGARASAPPIPGLEQAGYLTNETLFSLTELPKRIAIIGAGPIGCEMAQSFARFGSDVHLIELADQILPKQPANVARIIEQTLERDGINLTKTAKTNDIEIDNGEKIISIESDGKTDTIRVDEIIVSVGRKPNIENLGLENAGVDYDPKIGVTVNDYLQTSNKRIYAAGDICSPYKFTHTADAQAALVIQNALFLRTKKSSSLIVPWTTYTDPEVAHVGLYPKDAADQGIETTTFTASLSDVDRALLDGEEEGFAEIYVKKGGDKIVGATIVAGHAGEMIGEITTAMHGGLGLSSLSSVIHPYPTQSDVLRKSAREYMRSRLTPRVKRLMDRWMAWHR